MLRHRIIERHQAALHAQHRRARRRHDLRDGGHIKDRVLGHRLRRWLERALTKGLVIRGAIALHPQRCADDLGFGDRRDLGIEGGEDFGMKAVFSGSRDDATEHRQQEVQKDALHGGLCSLRVAAVVRFRLRRVELRVAPVPVHIASASAAKSGWDTDLSPRGNIALTPVSARLAVP